jgi:hypothetical protein
MSIKPEPENKYCTDLTQLKLIQNFVVRKASLRIDKDDCASVLKRCAFFRKLPLIPELCN